MSYDLLLFAHVLGATVLLGTGAGIVFFMVMSHQSQDPALIAHVAGIVVLADTVFTATAAVFQLITGVLLARCWLAPVRGLGRAVAGALHLGWPVLAASCLDAAQDA